MEMSVERTYSSDQLAVTGGTRSAMTSCTDTDVVDVECETYVVPSKLGLLVNITLGQC